MQKVTHGLNQLALLFGSKSCSVVHVTVNALTFDYKITSSSNYNCDGYTPVIVLSLWSSIERLQLVCS